MPIPLPALPVPLQLCMGYQAVAGPKRAPPARQGDEGAGNSPYKDPWPVVGRSPVPVASEGPVPVALIKEDVGRDAGNEVDVRPGNERHVRRSG